MKDGTAERILEAASELFAEQGALGTSLGDIAKATGLSKGTLYYYYPSKQDVIDAVAKRTVKAVGDRLFAWVDAVKATDGAEEALGALCDALLGDGMLLRVFIALNNAAEPGSEPEALLDNAMNEWNVMIEVGSLRMQPGVAARMKRLLAAVIPFLCGLAALNADSEYAKDAFCALILG